MNEAWIEHAVTVPPDTLVRLVAVPRCSATYWARKDRIFYNIDIDMKLVLSMLCALLAAEANPSVRYNEGNSALEIASTMAEGFDEDYEDGEEYRNILRLLEEQTK